MMCLNLLGCSRYRQFVWLGGVSLLLTLSLSFLSPAIANMANPERIGDIVSEPLGDVATLDILHEDLVFDLRPLEQTNPVEVQATYQVRNSGAAVGVELLFVAPGLETGEVWLDEKQAIAATKVDAVSIPESWSASASSVMPAETDGLAFSLPLSPGEHTISVQYTALPNSDDLGVYRIYEMDYWLAPARQWKSFGTLTVDVFTPRGWPVEMTPALSSVTRNHWQRTFDELPGDSLNLAAYPVLPFYVTLLRWSLVLGGLCLAATSIWFSYRWLGQVSKRQQWSQGWLVLSFLLLVPLSVPLLWSIGGLAVYLSERLLDTRHLSVGYSYGRFYLYAFLGLLSGAIALSTAIISFAYGHRTAQLKKISS